MTRKKILFIKIFLHVLLPLVAGGLIYILYRPSVWFTDIFNFNEGKINSEKTSFLEKLFIFSGPDFCWDYSFASSVFLLNFYYKFSSKEIIAIVVLLFLIVSETVQLFLEKWFTFSYGDLIAAIIAVIISLLFTPKNAKS